MKKIIYLSAMVAAVGSVGHASFDPMRDCPKITGGSLGDYREGHVFNDRAAAWRVVANPLDRARYLLPGAGIRPEHEGNIIGPIMSDLVGIENSVQDKDGKSQVFCHYGRAGARYGERLTLVSTDHRAARQLNDNARAAANVVRDVEASGSFHDVGDFFAPRDCPVANDVLQGVNWRTIAHRQTFNHGGVIWTVGVIFGPGPRALRDLVLNAVRSQVINGPGVRSVNCVYSYGESQIDLRSDTHPRLRFWAPTRP